MESNYRENWYNKLNELKSMHTDIAALCKNKSIAYIDIPLHFNVGDQLIYAGTEQFISNHGLDVKYRAFDVNVEDKKLAECDLILFHGGGNFGDIYPRHQHLRESIIQKFPNKRIIVLPQTIHFSSLEQQEKSSKIFSKHNDLYMYVRDQRSLQIAQSFSKNAVLMPDMAHSLHPLIDKSEVESFEPSTVKILNLRRVDVEKVSEKINIEKKSFDWINILEPTEHTYLKYIKKLQRFKILNRRLIRSWRARSQYLIFRSINYFSLHNVIYTDRLHGFILSYLLGKNIKLLDNSYGKNLGYYKQWINDKSLVEVITKEK